MAKEKEKLFKGIDDKAITFQRAVFIVCNLKRLIKRPKKDEKQSQGSGSRKRSGAEDEMERAPGGSRRKGGRLKEPVRRAFTLPTMLCGTLGLVAQNKAAAVASSITNQYLDPSNQTELANSSSGGEDELADAWRCAALEAGSAPRTRLKWAPPAQLANCSGGSSRQLGAYDGSAGSSSSEFRAMINSVSSLSCLVTPIKKVNRTAAAAFATNAVNSDTTNSSTSTLHNNNNNSGNNNSSCNYSYTSDLSNPELGGSGTGTDFDRRHPLLPQLPSRHQDQLLCPVWALIMAELDARQEQPRDQSHFAHLIGPPAASGFLQAPSQEPTTTTTTTTTQQQLDKLAPRLLVSGSSSDAAWSETSLVRQVHHASSSAVNTFDANQLQLGQDRPDAEDEDEELVMAGGSWTLATSKQQLRRSSEESAMENRLGKCSNNSGWRKDHHHHHHHQCQNRQPEDQMMSTAGDFIQNHAGQPALGHETGRAQAGDPSTSFAFNIGLSTPVKRKQRQARDQAKSSKNQHHQQQQQLHQLDPMGMKRFSSALCLVDQQQAPTKAEGKRHQQMVASLMPIGHRRSASPRRGDRSGSHQVDTTSGHKFLAAQDPMLLARQRRPSASNQGSVNVDQQALFSAVECNQLERAKAILDDGKANVNSLNSDKLTCLDIAVLMRNVEMVKLLQQYHAKESSAYLTREGRANQLYALYTEARRLVEDLSRSIPATSNSPAAASGAHFGQQAPMPNTSDSSPTQANDQGAPLMLATGSLLSNALLEEKQRQLQYWRRRLDLFMHMRYEFERLEVPSAPELLVLQVVGENSLGAKIVHTLKANNRSVSSYQLCQSALGQPIIQASGSLAPSGASLAEAASRCTRGPKCSHWQLSDLFDHQQQQQELQTAETRASVQFRSDAIEDEMLVQPGASWLSLADKQQAMIKQQKLLVFNQLLAQQLKLLSCQQRDAGKLTCPPNADSTSQSSGRRRARVTMAQSSSTDSESLGSRQSFGDAPGNCCDSLTGALGGPSCGLVGGSDLDPPCASLAYQLMTTGNRKHHAHAGRADRNHHHHHHHHQLQSVNSKESGLGERRFGRVSGDGRGVIITKYKVEWSHNEQMEPILSSMIVYNTNLYPLECQINGLTNGQLYYVRVAAGNHKGFCEPKPTSPACLSPSSWRQVDGSKRRRCDEEVFRKFTKLILLNKHILDDHSSSGSSAGVAATQSSGVRSGASHLATSGHSGPILAGNQNKSSLINMLLLDATMPSGRQLIKEHGLASDEFQQQQQQLQNHQDLMQPQQQQSSTSMRKNLKNFFQSNSFKFHKLNNQNKRGLYLTTVIYYSPGRQSSIESAATAAGRQQRPTPNHLQTNTATNASSTIMSSNDKIVVTNDDRLPIIEVVNDVVSPAALMGDFYWLLKINGTQWMDIKRLRQQLQKSHSSSTLHLRIKLLCAIEQMQVALNLEDIGRLFYKPIQAHDGSIVICTCKQVASTKLVSNLSIKWTHQHKIIPRHLRKISDSMLSDQQQQGEQRDWSAQSSRRLRTEANFGPGNLGTNLDQPQSALSSSLSQVATASAAQAAASGSGSVAARTDAGEAGCSRASHFRLCDYCQHTLIQRRSTMASGSSNSSLASSNDSNWSSSGMSMSSSGQCRCSCGRSSASTTTTGISNLLSAPSSQRNSTSTSARSGSMMSGSSQSGNRDSLASLSQSQSSSRNSQPHHHLTSAQKSSNYLMLASLSLYDLLLFTMNEIIHFDRCSTVPLTRGLYLGFVQLQTTVESMRLLVPRNRPNMVPCARVRDNAHVSREEWQLLKKFAALGNPQQLQQTLKTAPISAQPSSLVATNDQRKIWSSEVAHNSGQRLVVAGEATSGGPRNRATSVSPGMLQQQQAMGGEQRDSLSLSSDLIVGHGCTGGSSPATNARANYSDSDLRLAKDNDERDDQGHHLHPEGDKKQAPAAADEGGAERTAGAVVSSSSENNNNNNANNSDANSRHADSISQKSYQFCQSDVLSLGLHSRTRRGSRSPTAASRVTVNSMVSGLVQSPEETFVRLVGSAARRLLAELRSQLPKVSPPPPPPPANDTSERDCINNNNNNNNSNSANKCESSILQSLNDDENNRIYHLELIELSNQVAFILLIPSSENVCPVTSQEKSNILGDNKDYMLLPLQIFETIHISTYEPDLLGKYSRLSAILETDLIVAQHDHRQAFSSNELKSAKTRVSHLQDMVSIADEFWRKLRWIVDVVSFARDKSTAATNGGIKLGTIWRYFELSPSTTYDNSMNWLQISQQHQWNNHQQQQQQQPQPTKAAQTSRLGMEVKRTTSARASRDHPDPSALLENRRTSGTMENVPEIYLTQSCSSSSGKKWQSPEQRARHDEPPPLPRRAATSSRQHQQQQQKQPGQPEQPKQQQLQQQWSANTVRRHRGSDAPVQKMDTTSGLEDQAEEGELALVELRLRDSSEDEEAIYAYHISLRDATRAAAQRKSSQQSTRAMADEEPPTSSGPTVVPSTSSDQFPTTYRVPSADRDPSTGVQPKPRKDSSEIIPF